MKNVFKKTVALVSALSLVAVGTAVSVSASAEKIDLQVKAVANEESTGKVELTSSDDYNVYTVEPGSKVNVQIAMVDSVGAKWDTIQFRNTLGGLKLESGNWEPEDANAMVAPDGSFVQFNKSAGQEQEVKKANQVYMTYIIDIPADAKNGDSYTIDWADPSGYEFNLINTHVSKENQAYTTKGAKFVVEGPVVETTVVTTTEAPVTTTTTTSATTTEAVTTVETTAETTVETTTAVTTTAETTAASTSAVSTSKVSAQPASPATGSSSNGVAALAVTMVAAAGAAIALKKKND
jgi:LPXTG-motif cell wall-anchored protein